MHRLAKCSIESMTSDVDHRVPAARTYCRRHQIGHRRLRPLSHLLGRARTVRLYHQARSFLNLRIIASLTHGAWLKRFNTFTPLMPPRNAGSVATL